MKNILSALLCLASLALAAPALGKPVTTVAAATREGEAFFSKYMRLERAYDPRIADLYDDEAIIEHKAIDGSGKDNTVAIPARTYKQYLRDAMPLAKFRGDYNVYSDITYSNENGGIRINANRYAGLNGGYNPISLLLLPAPGGKWMIFEEFTESRAP